MVARLRSILWVPDRAVPLARAVPSGMRVEECSGRAAYPFLIPDRVAEGGTDPGPTRHLKAGHPKVPS